jgi:hypothetical protein
MAFRGALLILLAPDAALFEVGVDHCCDFLHRTFGLHKLVAIPLALKAPAHRVEPFFQEPPGVATCVRVRSLLAPARLKVLKSAKPSGNRPHPSVARVSPFAPGPRFGISE